MKSHNLQGEKTQLSNKPVNYNTSFGQKQTNKTHTKKKTKTNTNQTNENRKKKE